MATTADTTPLKKRSVVSSFILSAPDKTDDAAPGEDRVALFKRSDKVNTYQHHWGAISGGIEKTDASPLAAAWREIHEETTLTPAVLDLVRQGKPYVFSDPSVGREWTIYPFLYRLKTPADNSAIHIDWEHDGWQWFDPNTVEDDSSFGGVPHLAKSLRRAWFERDLGAAPGSAGAVLARGLDVLKNDHQSGARQLAGVSLQVLRDVIRALPVSTTTEEWWTKVRFAAWHIWKNGRESMGAAIIAVLLDVLKGMESSLRQADLPRVRDDAVKDLDRRIAQRASSSSAKPVADALLECLSLQSSERLAKTSTEPQGSPALSLLTLSESSTIAYFLQQLVSCSRFATIDLRVLESRPLFEGVSLAASLADYMSKSGYNTATRTGPTVTITVYTDAAVAMAADGVDLVLLGADRIASSGAVSNKTGSLPAALSAKVPGRQRAAKVVVVGETEKIAAPGSPYEHVVEDNDPVQVTRTWHSSSNSQRVREGAAALDRAGASHSTTESPVVCVRNVFFEWVPPELVDAYVTEQGIWTLQDIGQHSAALGREEKRLLGDL